jgi:hypothetical protein
MKATPYVVGAGVAVLVIAVLLLSRSYPGLLRAAEAGVAVLVIAVLLLWGYFKGSAKDTGGKVQWIDVNKLERGPVLRESLTKEQMARLEQIHQTFAEVDGFTLDKRLDDFKRDHDPDRELAVWERMTRAYQRFVASRNDLSLEAKKEVYRVVLLRSMATEEEVLARQKNSVLSQDDARTIMRDY